MKRPYTHYNTRVFTFSPEVPVGLSALASAPMVSAWRSSKAIRQIINGLTRNAAAAFALGTLVLSFASGRVSARQSANNSDANVQAKPYSAKIVAASGEDAMKRTTQDTSTTQTAPQTTSPPPEQAELKRATPFNGDLRDLPQTKPVNQERPARKAPKLRPRMLPPRS